MAIVGAVQFKQEAGLTSYRYHFLVVGAGLVLLGFALLLVKCVWFRTAYPIVMTLVPAADENAAAAENKTPTPAAGAAPPGKDPLASLAPPRTPLRRASVGHAAAAVAAEREEEEDKEMLIIPMAELRAAASPAAGRRKKSLPADLGLKVKQAV